MKWSPWLASCLFLGTVVGAQQKPIAQRYVRDFVEARTIAVLAAGSPSSPEDTPENQRVRLDVQNALLKWGKYQVVLDASTADLIVVVHKSHVQTMPNGSPSTAGPVMVGPVDSGVNIGMGRGQTQPLSRTDIGRTGAGTRAGAEAGAVEDVLDVYLGRKPLIGDASRNSTQYPLDEPAAWSYEQMGALQSPKLEAIVAFRKAVEAAEKKKP